MSLALDQLGPSRRNKRGHSKPSVYRKIVKNSTVRKRRRVPKDQIPDKSYNGYD